LARADGSWHAGEMDLLLQGQERRHQTSVDVFREDSMERIHGCVLEERAQALRRLLMVTLAPPPRTANRGRHTPNMGCGYRAGRL